VLRSESMRRSLHGDSRLIATETITEREESLSVEDVSTMLNISPQTLRKHIREVKLPAARFGLKWRIRRSDLEALFGR
jgi:excisionase family DNA binding protein